MKLGKLIGFGIIHDKRNGLYIEIRRAAPGEVWDEVRTAVWVRVSDEVLRDVREEIQLHLQDLWI